MRYRKFARLGTVVMPIVLASCDCLDPAIQLDADDNGTAVTVAVSECFRVSLNSNPSTGYVWEVAESDASILETTGQRFAPAPGPDMPGKGGTDIWDFTGRSPGSTTLRLEYRRPWETEGALDSFEVTVTVTASK